MNMYTQAMPEGKRAANNVVVRSVSAKSTVRASEGVGGTSSAASTGPTKKIWRGITMCASCCESPERALLMQKAGVLVSQDSMAFIGSLENRGFSFEVIDN
jgi:hypothetical protein